MNNYTVQVSAKLLQWPYQCACCQSTPDSILTISYTKNISKNKQTTRSWEVPYCSDCIHHINIKQGADRELGKGLLIAMSIWLVIGLITKNWWGGLLISFPTFIYFWRKYNRQLIPFAKSKMKSSCTALESSIIYEGWQGTIHTFRFSNFDFARNFALSNKTKVLDYHTHIR